jgi:hypothetical protein
MFTRNEDSLTVHCLGCGYAQRVRCLSVVSLEAITPEQALIYAAREALYNFWITNRGVWMCGECYVHHPLNQPEGEWGMPAEYELDLSALPQIFSERHLLEFCAWTLNEERRVRRFTLRWPLGFGGPADIAVTFDVYGVNASGKKPIRFRLFNPCDYGTLNAYCKAVTREHEAYHAARVPSHGAAL